jgi:hypothetical protein
MAAHTRPARWAVTGGRRGSYLSRWAATAIGTLAAAAVLGAAPGRAAVIRPHHVPCAGCALRAAAPTVARGATATDATSYNNPNWAGYTQSADTGGTYTAVRDYWTVPTVSTRTAGDQYSFDWVGIGGAADSSLVNAGTAANNLDGTPQYYAWTQVWPSGRDEIPGLVIHPGDEMYSLVKENSPGIWQLTVEDVTTGQQGGRTVSYDSPGLSAEAIDGLPAPLGVFGSFPLASTANVTFEPTYYSTAAPGTQNWQPLLTSAPSATLWQDFMTGSSGSVIASPSAGDPYHDGFTVADGATSPAAPPEAAALVFDDYIGTVDSIQAVGTNQNGQAQDACFTTPKTVNFVPNFWWTAGTKIWAYTSGNCTTGKLRTEMYLTDSPTVPLFHCQEDVSPYRDWNPGSNWQSCAINPPPNGVWYGYAVSSFVKDM